MRAPSASASARLSRSTSYDETLVKEVGWLTYVCLHPHREHQHGMPGILSLIASDARANARSTAWISRESGTQVPLTTQ
jgi:hypothetical protein